MVEWTWGALREPVYRALTRVRIAVVGIKRERKTGRGGGLFIITREAATLPRDHG